MAATKQLRSENKELREEIAQLKEKIDEISFGLKVVSREGSTTSDQTKSIEFLSNRHDDFVKFTKTAMKGIKEITARIDKIEKKCDLKTQALECLVKPARSSRKCAIEMSIFDHHTKTTTYFTRQRSTGK